MSGLEARGPMSATEWRGPSEHYPRGAMNRPRKKITKKTT
jgi:hypothetical protein